jgi:hypothetical protein
MRPFSPLYPSELLASYAALTASVRQEESRFAWSARCYVVHKPTLRELHDDVPVDCAPRPYTEAVDADAVYFVYVMVKHGC